MKLWTAYRHLQDDQEALMFSVLASLVARQQKIEVGLIASKEDAARLRAFGLRHDGFIEADLPKQCGAVAKLTAIANYLPDGDALVDGDVFLTKPLVLSADCAWALNWEPLRLYRAYPQGQPIEKCWPKREQTINAGLLYAPSAQFRKYARAALELARQIECIGHTYEQMFFVRFCQDEGISLRAVIDRNVHAHREVEEAWQKSGIRHPFCYKHSLREAQRCIDLAVQFADCELVKRLLARFWPLYKIMAERPLFQPF